MSEIQYKRCLECKQEFPATPEYFARNKNKKFGIDCYCHTCNRQRTTKWEKDHVPYVRKRQHQYSLDHIEKIRQTKRDWNARNPENVRINKKISEQRRKTRKLNLPDDFTLEDWNYALSYFGNRCAVCGRIDFSKHILAMDHWIPLSDDSSDNPGNVPFNVVPLCHGKNGCNNVKKHRNAMVWLTEQYGQAEADHLLSRIMEFFKTVRNGKTNG
jgi:hypothetical protein